MNLIPEGRYNARAREWGLGKTQTGKVQFAVEFEILDGVYAGQRRTWYGLFVKGEKDGKPYDLGKRTLESLRYCGWTGDNIAEVRELPNTVGITIQHDTYQGQTRDRVGFVNRLGGLALKNELGTSEAAAFAAKVTGMAMSISKDLAKPGETPIPQDNAPEPGSFDGPPPGEYGADPTEGW